jgi:hypothetical protein
LVVVQEVLVERMHVLLLGAAVGVGLALTTWSPAGATGTGPNIWLQTVSANVVRVNATADSAGWTAFNVHLSTQVSGGVTLNGISSANGLSLTGQTFCATAAPSATESILGCAGLAQQSITNNGSLADFTFAATGNGCITVAAVSAPGDTALDTYTVDASTITPQPVTITNANVNVLVGTGTVSNCLGSADSDDDGYTDAQEFALGKNPFTYCATMRADMNVDHGVDGRALNLLAKQFLQNVPPANARRDLNADAMVNGLDLGILAKQFLKNVSVCP